MSLSIYSLSLIIWQNELSVKSLIDGDRKPMSVLYKMSNIYFTALSREVRQQA